MFVWEECSVGCMKLHHTMLMMLLHRDSELYSSLPMSTEPHVPPVSVQQLIQQSSAEAGWDNTVVGGGVFSSTQASKVLCRLAHEVDR